MNMSKSEDLWNIVVKEGLNNYENQLGHARVSTLVLVGAPKSVSDTVGCLDSGKWLRFFSIFNCL